MNTEAKKIEGEITKYHEVRERLIRESLPREMSEADKQRFIDTAIPQSLLFMMEIIPYIHRLYQHEPDNILKTVLDVGPQNMAGTGLLQEVHSKKSFNRLRLKVDAIDIVDNFKMLGKILARDVELIKSDVYSIRDRSWDFVIASHVIEHVPDPVKFVKKLQGIAKDFVIIACPWREFPITTKSHINTIDKEFTKSVGARGLDIFTNYSWGKQREVCIFWLPGAANK